MKKYLSLLLAVIMAFALFGCSAKPEMKNDYQEVYTKTQDSAEFFTYDVGDDGVFEILKFNDTHFINGTCDDDKKTLNGIETALKTEKYDLVVVDGDLIEGYNKKISFNKYKALDAFAALMEKYGANWAYVPGNNDGQKDGTNEEIIAYLLQYPHFICANEEKLTGSSQYFIELTKDGKTVHQLAFLDSLSLDENKKYDYIKEDQIDWLINRIEEKGVYTSVFFHMPTPEFKTAIENGTAYDGYPFSDEYAVDDVKGNSLFDSKTAGCDLISMVSVGHVHSDDVAYFHNSRWYHLSRMSGYGAVGSKNRTPGYSRISINTNEKSAQKLYALACNEYK